MKKNLLLCITMLFVTGLLASHAMAFSLGGYVGGVQLDFNGWSTDNDPYDGDFSGTATGLQDGIENVWAIGNVSTISDLYYNPLWSGSPSEEITAIIYGADDISYTSGGFYGNNIYSFGVDGDKAFADGAIHIDLYLNVPGTWSSVSGDTSDRTAYDKYTNVTDGELMLSMEMVPGWILDDPATPLIDESVATLFQNATGTTSPASGTGFFYAIITGGSEEDLFGKGGYVNGGAIADVQGQFTFLDDVAVPNNNFDNTIRPGSLVGTTVPEPGTMFLLGIGLLGLARLNRKGD